jgi:ribonuclease D
VNDLIEPRAGAIAHVADARELAARLFHERTIALDSEGDGMWRYRTQLCTIQLASEDEIAVVDTLAVDIGVFRALMSSRGPEKVVHDAAFDARLLSAYGAPLGAVFDTAVAARYLGFTATGLASLLLQLFDVTVPKHMQQADWGKRPLSLEAIEYLENDVRYLIPLRDVLLERLRERDIEAEMREECEYVLREAAASQFEPSPFSRLKGALQRPPEERARLYELANVRDELGRELNLPPARVVANDLLLRFGELHQPMRAELERRLPSRYRGYAQRFVDALARAEGQADAPRSELPDPNDVPPATELAKRKRRRELLTSFRTRAAAARGVDPQVVLPGHCINDLVKLDGLTRECLEQVSGFGECRIERYGEAFRRAFGDRW